MKAHLIEVLLIVGLAIIGIVDGLAPDKSITFQRESLPPGMYLVVISALLFVLAVVFLWSGRKSQEKNNGSSTIKPGAGLAMWAVMVGYAALVPVLGYSITTFFFFAVLFFVLGIKPWWRTGALGLVFAVAFYVAFVMLANVWLPSGLVGRLFEGMF